MPGLDLHGFVAPVEEFQGLNRLSNQMERQGERNAELQRQQQAKKATNSAFLANYLDPKDSLTGTNYDPQIVAGFDRLLQDGVKMASEGADTNMMMMALAPGVAKLNQYSTKAKLINQRLKDQLAQIPKNAGYDLAKLEQEAKKYAFTDESGKLRDINTIDPQVDFVTETVKRFPDRVTTDAGIDEYVKSSPKFSNTQTVKRTNEKGGYEMRKSKVTAPSWMVVDDEGELVPRYDVALEGGKPHTFDFTTGDGRTKNAAIRLMNEKDFDSIMSGNPGIADYVKGQVLKANPKIDWESPQAKNAARAILYDELKRRKPGGMEDVEMVKENPAPRISLHVTNNSGGTGVNVNDLYGRIQGQVAEEVSKGFTATRFNKLKSDEQSAIIDYVNKVTPADEKYAGNELVLHLNPNDEVEVYKSSALKDGYSKENLITTLPKVGTNIKAQVDVKAKRKVVADGDKPVEKPKEDLRKKYNY